MIHVEPQTEPPVFDAKVRKPGQRFLRRTPHPTGRQWGTHSYWREILPQLHDAYRGICAYSCHWIPYDTGSDTVEHFLAKDRHEADAYEWRNYRLVCGTLNGRKGVHEDVLDPFVIHNGWFVLDFPSLLVKPSDDIDEELKTKVQKTVDRLTLNDEQTCLKARAAWLRDYCAADPIPFMYLKRNAPFIAAELERQGLVQSIKQIFV